ncbi:MAG: NAD-dependent DNA ligase LigA [Spirochaetales bacterium]|nr:NAD-dependent DNA ligase LigA [Spirochaetales bacterium]
MAISIENLARLIEYHQDKYYNDQPEITDAEFDALWDELADRAPDHPIFSRVGADGVGEATKREHLMPMNSQDKASTPEQFRKWAERAGHERYIVQYKLDGASIELQYREGRFAHGVTRGDGRVGDDITANVSRMAGVPHELQSPFTGAVRGEVIMTHEIHRLHYSDKANCRNAANGLMKRKDGKGSEHLRILAYDAFTGGERPFVDEIEKISWIEAQGFVTVPYVILDTPDEVIHHRDVVSEARDGLGYDIDGLVVKGPEIDPADMQRTRPQKQIAFKFSTEEAASVLREVEWSESGHLHTPVGIIDPVQLAGTTVRRASLVHPELIAEMDLRINSEVIVTKRGDIIPKIERLIRHGDDSRSIEIPRHCSTCGTELVNEGKRLYCPNVACPRRDFHRLQKWIRVLDVRDFGDVLLKRLFDDGVVREIADLYAVSWETIAEFEGMGELSARKALGNLRSASVIPLARFVAGFDIAGIAELKIQKLVDGGFDTLASLRAASPEELATADGIAEATAVQVAEGLQSVREAMDRLLAGGAVSIEAPVSPATAEEQPLAGLSFCFTGTLTRTTRSEAEKLVRRYGGQARSGVSAELSYLVTNDPDSRSAKAKKARELEISIISEEDFFSRIPV